MCLCLTCFEFDTWGIACFTIFSVQKPSLVFEVLPAVVCQLHLIMIGLWYPRPLKSDFLLIIWVNEPKEQRETHSQKRGGWKWKWGGTMTEKDKYDTKPKLTPLIKCHTPQIIVAVVLSCWCSMSSCQSRDVWLFHRAAADLCRKLKSSTIMTQPNKP